MTQEEHCRSCGRRTAGVQSGESCWRCRLTAAAKPGVQVVTVADVNGIYTYDQSLPELMETHIVFPDCTYVVRDLPTDPNITHVLMLGNRCVHYVYQSPVSPINGVRMCLNWIVNTRTLARVREREQVQL